ncbi:hypothetical protein KDK95_10425 [Actinospica sp. MGRD01-02]|uniref:Uncharacterized protein n=1 Tax=Actinospica acidithermotolerans TaxID=2828514 RepID=A0A941ECX5_9ACTN|nr:hypothetical protein [Actinospica acidithermotolerans]MBR7826719.1 hypothetical protein [Actinospica acidithermotolerans]
MTSPNILGVLARVFVDDLDSALPVYRALADDAEPQRFIFRDVRLVRVGAFLLLSGDTAITRRTPDRIQGRVSSVYLALQGAATLLGMLIGSVAGQRLGVVTTMNLAALLIAASAVAAFLIQQSDVEGEPWHA